MGIESRVFEDHIWSLINRRAFLVLSSFLTHPHSNIGQRSAARCTNKCARAFVLPVPQATVPTVCYWYLWHLLKKVATCTGTAQYVPQCSYLRLPPRSEQSSVVTGVQMSCFFETRRRLPAPTNQGPSARYKYQFLPKREGSKQSKSI